MKKIILISVLLSFHAVLIAQERNLYNPSAKADDDLAAIQNNAKLLKKHVLIQIGGNWCGWCYEFARFAKADTKIDSVINAGFIWYHLNYSKENTNTSTLARLGFPQRFGFPVFVILDATGNRIHTQTSEYLEDGKKSYDKLKVLSFLEMWSPAALNPKLYEEKN